jgi:hypothetical protein
LNETHYRELRVPTSALEAEVLCADGRTFRGRIFVPDVAATHRGPMRPAEWMNDPAPFFPFLPADGGESVLMNRSEVLVFTVDAGADIDLDDPEGEGRLRRHVIVELRDRRFEGEVVIDMPAHLSRVLDYLNRPEPFLIVRDGDRDHLIRKARITRVVEPKETRA